MEDNVRQDMVLGTLVGMIGLMGAARGKEVQTGTPLWVRLGPTPRHGSQSTGILEGGRLHAHHTFSPTSAISL